MATLLQIITEVNTLRPNAYTDAQKIVWFNQIDEKVKLNELPTYVATNIRRLANVYSYSLPNGVDFEDIDSVFLNGSKIPYVDVRSNDVFYNGEKAYFNSSGVLGISPTPTSSDEVSEPSLRVVYKQEFTPHTATSETLLITNEYKSVYTWYLLAMMSFFDEDYDKYNNLMQQYNTAYNEFSNQCANLQPVNKSKKIRNIW